MFKILNEDRDALVTVITPLKEGHKISRETRNTIKRNDIPFNWYSHEAGGNRPINIEMALKEIEKRIGLPEYFIPIDNNMELGRHFIDRLYDVLIRTNENVAYAYGNLQYRGKINYNFPAAPWDLSKLLQNNYISSNSLFKTDYVLEVGLVKDQDMQRLLDWALLIQLARFGYAGIPVPTANHIAWTTKENISAQNDNDFNLKKRNVHERIIKPFLEEIKMNQLIQQEADRKFAEDDSEENVSLFD